jgi:GNAT superfamily N-acetyltransferase
MKKILNEWRKFILNEAAPSVPYDDDHLEKDLCVYHWDDDDEEHHIILYRKQKYVDDFYVIGYIAAMQITEPGDDRLQCIPNTFQVSAVYVEPSLQGQDFGKLLYSLAFAAIPDGAGLTSDKYSGTLPGAKRVWDKMSNSSEYVKRQTAMGNDKFDYTTYDTPDDPEDDCGTPYKGYDDKNASHNSLEKVNNSAGDMLLNMYKSNHESNDYLNKEDFEKKVFSFAGYRFSQVYSSLTN